MNRLLSVWGQFAGYAWEKFSEYEPEILDGSLLPVSPGTRHIWHTRCAAGVIHRSLQRVDRPWCVLHNTPRKKRVKPRSLQRARGLNKNNIDDKACCLWETTGWGGAGECQGGRSCPGPRNYACRPSVTHPPPSHNQASSMRSQSACGPSLEEHRAPWTGCQLCETQNIKHTITGRTTCGCEQYFWFLGSLGTGLKRAGGPEVRLLQRFSPQAVCRVQFLRRRGRLPKHHLLPLGRSAPRSVGRLPTERQRREAGCKGSSWKEVSGVFPILLPETVTWN